MEDQMSDGMTDAYRSARAAEERQMRIDRFFGALAEYAASGGTAGARELAQAFDAFDAERLAGNIARHRLEKELPARRKAFLAAAKRTVEARQTLDDPIVRSNWGWALAMALRYGSAAAAARLQKVSPFKRHLLALYVPNGRHRDPDLLGDHASALDALMHGGGATVVRVREPERAIVSLTLGATARDRKENLEPELAELRLIAAAPKRTR
jgi:hypothetical protein